MATLTLTIDDGRARKLATLAMVDGYSSVEAFTRVKAAEIIDREWTSYVTRLVSEANTRVLTEAEKALVRERLGL